MNVQGVIDELSLNKAWDKYDTDCTYCQELQERAFTSLVDFFFCKEGLTDKITFCGVILFPDNNSDH